MKVRILMLILFGILLSVAAGFGTFQYSRALETELAAARVSLRAFGETVLVPVPVRDLAPGSILSHEDFLGVRIPGSYLPANVLQNLPPPSGGGFIALAALRQGALVLNGDIATSAGGPDYGFILSGDARAIAIKAQNLLDFIDRLKPGDPVDLLWTHNIGGGTTETRMIGSALRILALPGNSSEGPLADKMMLEGASQDAMRVVEASSSGLFSILPAARKLSLEHEEFVVGPADLATLPLVVRGGQTDGIAQASARARCQTAIVRGGARSVMDVPC
ncbi:hypothetical protein [Rhodobacter sp. 24-YEA-8]|uniref:hypothetical protein n=1 Tax=Rhodobacter sp. 24-YEA-8 TaxID=1884310 RepID=UPI00089D425E|nr:hypothetical protein [Rhodobacter sp. 24-YEA-8]SEC56531.1 Flp pilus assembly protein CpaB [Rhodobacter sp. 24-YEA-8]